MWLFILTVQVAASCVHVQYNVLVCVHSYYTSNKPQTIQNHNNLSPSPSEVSSSWRVPGNAPGRTNMISSNTVTKEQENSCIVNFRYRWKVSCLKFPKKKVSFTQCILNESGKKETHMHYTLHCRLGFDYVVKLLQYNITANCMCLMTDMQLQPKDSRQFLV